MALVSDIVGAYRRPRPVFDGLLARGADEKTGLVFLMLAMLLGFVMAMWFYIWNPSLPGRLATSQKPLYDFLLNKWYFDEIYDAIFVRPAKALGRFLWKRGDGNVIDGTLNGVAMGIIPFFTRLAGRLQSGYIFTYAFAMVIGIAVLVTWMTMTGGSN